MTTRQRIALWSLLGSALLVRVLLVVSLEDKPFFYIPIVDSAAFDRWASRIAAGQVLGGSAFFQDPLYAYGLGAFYAAWGRDLLAARLVQCAIGTFGLWMLFEAVRRLRDYPTAIAALVLGASAKTLIFFDGMLLKDFLGVAAIEAALLFFAIDRKWKWLAFGAALGAGALVRGNTLLLIVTAAGLLAARREWKPAGMTLAGALAAVAPVTTHNIAASGQFVLTTSHFGANLYIGNNAGNTSGRYRPPPFVEAATPELEESGFREEAERLNGRPMRPAEVDAYWRGRAISWIWSNPGTFAGVTAKRALMLVNGFEIPDDHDLYFMARFSWVLRLPLLTFGLFLAPLAVTGMYLAWAERARLGMLYALLAAYLASISIFFVFARYRLPLFPILIVFAAFAITRSAQMIAWRLRAVPKVAALIFLVAAAAVNIPLPRTIGGHRDFRVAHYNLGIYYVQVERHADAAREFEAAAELNPEYRKDPRFVWNLAEAYERSASDKALPTFIELAAMEGGESLGPLRAGLVYHRAGMQKQAVEWLERARARDPGLVEVYAPLAEAHRILGRPDRALEVLKGAPDDWTIHLKRAELCRDLSMWPQALQSAERALALRPAHRAALRIRDEAAEKTRQK